MIFVFVSVRKLHFLPYIIVFLRFLYCILTGRRHGRPTGRPQHEPGVQEPSAAAAHCRAAATAPAAAGKHNININNMKTTSLLS